MYHCTTYMFSCLSRSMGVSRLRSPAWWASGFPGNLQQCTPWSVVMHICIIYHYVSLLEINLLLLLLLLRLGFSRIIVCMVSANDRPRYNVTSILIGWAHTQNDSRFWSHVCRHWVCTKCLRIPSDWEVEFPESLTQSMVEAICNQVNG